MTKVVQDPTLGHWRPPQASRPGKVQRFVASERFLHWALAIPFVVLYASALAMLIFWGEPQPRHVRTAASWIHKIAGLCLIVFPPLVLVRGKREWRVHLSNLKEAWIWTKDDIRWLLVSPLAAVDRRVQLPEQGRFNAAEKLNFMMVCTTYPLYIATGLLIWAPQAALVPWILHLAMAAAGLALVAGHIYMATVNPSTRTGLEGMITGWVDREWAKHHYRRWFRECFEPTLPEPSHRSAGTLLKQPASIRCGTCGAIHAFDSWERLLQRVFQVTPLFCAKCENEIVPAVGQTAPDLARAVLEHLKHRSPDDPLGVPDRSAARSDRPHVVRAAPLGQSILWRPIGGEAPEPTGGGVPIYIRQRALAALHDQVRGAGGQGILGFLVGNLHEDPGTRQRWVEVQRVLPRAPSTDRDTSTAMIARVWEGLQQEVERHGDHMIGWYHSHPAGHVVLDPDDVEAHGQYFPHSWQVALVVAGGEPEFLGAFYRPTEWPVEANGALPFLEIVDPESITPEGKRRTRVTWKNYRPDARRLPTSPPAPLTTSGKQRAVSMDASHVRRDRPLAS